MTPPDTVTLEGAPIVSVVRGNPTPEELAALVTVILARHAATGSDAGPGAATTTRSGWSDRNPMLRAPFPRGWRRSALPS
jgi:hypothetical protein